jgi:hypothetical protein
MSRLTRKKTLNHERRPALRKIHADRIQARSSALRKPKRTMPVPRKSVPDSRLLQKHGNGKRDDEMTTMRKSGRILI